MDKIKWVWGSSQQQAGMPLDFCENNWKPTCTCRLTENEHKKRQKVQQETDEKDKIQKTENGTQIGGERIGPKITEKSENNGKSISLNKSQQYPKSVQIDCQLCQINDTEVFAFSQTCDTDARSRSIRVVPKCRLLWYLSSHQVWIDKIHKCLYAYHS